MSVKTRTKWNQTIRNYKWYNPRFLHSFKSPVERFWVARLREAKPEMCTLGTSCLWDFHLPSSERFTSPLLWSMDPSSCRSWVSPHIYYLQRHNPFFFSFSTRHRHLVYPIAGANIALDWFLLEFFLQITSNQMLTGVVAPISTVKTAARDSWKWKQQISEKTLDVLCCVIVFTPVLRGDFLATHTLISAIRTLRQRERPTLTDNKDSE